MKESKNIPDSENEVRVWLLIVGGMVGAGVVAATTWVSALLLAPPRSPRAAEARSIESSGSWSENGVSLPGARRFRNGPSGDESDLQRPTGLDPAAAALHSRTHAAHDPQLERSNASFDNAGDAGVASIVATERQGHIVAVSGDSPVRAGQSCDIRLLPVITGGDLNCLVRVSCDGVLLYPDPDQAAGYVACESDNGMPTYAADRAPTHQDTDPRIEVAFAQNRIRVGDETPAGVSYVAEIRIDDSRI